MTNIHTCQPFLSHISFPALQTVHTEPAGRALDPLEAHGPGAAELALLAARSHLAKLALDAAYTRVPVFSLYEILTFTVGIRGFVSVNYDIQNKKKSFMII